MRARPLSEIGVGEVARGVDADFRAGGDAAAPFHVERFLAADRRKGLVVDVDRRDVGGGLGDVVGGPELGEVVGAGRRVDENRNRLVLAGDAEAGRVVGGQDVVDLVGDAPGWLPPGGRRRACADGGRAAGR